MKIKSVEDFALAVVQSSNPSLSVQEKISLYIEATKLAKKHNDELATPEAKTQRINY